ncbi:uncharacterized protein [Rutidosis leptorrhynchoides]|uniref:uncharacterized protein n=1 Tax=Rutidosis leptorrhynchoides TaxID=125765 RepID=UPI003A996147
MTRENVDKLIYYCDLAWYKEVEDMQSKPMVWIGVYVAAASILCSIAMGADLLHGFRNRKLWFPSKYFTLDAASITVITVAMKLPVDLNTFMPGYLDQVTKLGSMAFMCTMMANIMPSLASMNNKTLLANVIGLVILVITIVVNICIEISTGVIQTTNIYVILIAAYIYLAMLLWLLIIIISSAIMIPSTKQILEFKYQVACKRTLDDQNNLMAMVENLRQYVRKYWVMAESGSPQFVLASNRLSSTSAIICVIILLIELLLCISLQFELRDTGETISSEWGSDYNWSVFSIFISQLIGIVVGTIAPIFRCFTIMNFNLFTNKNHFVIFKVEKYWFQQLCEWKESHIIFLSSGSWSLTFLRNLKNLFLELCIRIQKVIVVSSKMIGLIPIVISILIMYILRTWKSLVAMLFKLPPFKEDDDINSDLSDYVLQLEDDMKLSNQTLKRISNAINKFIQDAEKEQNKDLLVFLHPSTGFKGVESFDSDQVEALTSVKLVNSWSLPVVTLTCIAISLPNISNVAVHRLLDNVRESLRYTSLVEETVNNTREYSNILKATTTLWYEVEEKRMWLENTIKKGAFGGKTPIEVLEWFAVKAKTIVSENETTNGEVMVNNPKNLILANSMYRNAQTILFNYQANVEMINEDIKLFELLSSMISDILSACFTNIRRVIEMKCRESVIEKRESSVMDAAKLFGRTQEILKRVEGWELPSMDSGKMGFIDEWRLHLKRTIP